MIGVFAERGGEDEGEGRGGYSEILWRYPSSGVVMRGRSL
jgi:hypothetical protein